MSEGWRERLAALDHAPLGDGLVLHEAVRYGARRRGLAGVDALPPDVGLRIHKCNAVHTFGMRFALDLVWLDRHGAPVRVDLAVAPRRVRGCLRARRVVETAAGSGERFAASLSSGVLNERRSSSN